MVYGGVDKHEGKTTSLSRSNRLTKLDRAEMDTFLQIGHEDDPLKEYLDELHECRPPRHRKFIEDVKVQSTLREFVHTRMNPEMVGLYNEIVQSVYDFRTRHLEYAASYIHKQARDSAGNPVDIGTGGTPFMKCLKKRRDESGRHLLSLGGAKTA